MSHEESEDEGPIRAGSDAEMLPFQLILDYLKQIMARVDAAPLTAASLEDSAFRFDVEPATGHRQIRHTRSALPNPRLLRKIIHQRQLRARFFDGDLFADPAWDMLLDLAAARAEHKRVSVTSLCIASGVPTTTALRWINVLTAAGLLERTEDDTDRRRVFIALTDHAADMMARYFIELGVDADRLI